MKVLTYDDYAASYDDIVKGNPITILKEEGVEYIHHYCNPMGGWWFWGCKNIPENLNKYFFLREENPLEYIGWGLSEEKAHELYEKSNN